MGIMVVFGIQVINIKENAVNKKIENDFTVTQTQEQNNRSEKNTNDSDSSTDIEMDWDKLLATNSDVVAWIKIPGTNINQPILKGSSNDQYLRHNLYNKYSYSGSIFISENTKHPFNEVNTVIYGHNLNNRMMFSDLKKYKNSNFWQNNQYVYIYFPDGSMKTYRIISFHTIQDADKNILGTYYNSFKEFEPYINEDNIYLGKVPEYDADEIGGVITLATCTNRKSTERYVIHAIIE